ncbi:MAG: insulinase family protein [Clostridia bacterium]|nr:insulinase family protein [Clostridia bacterium]
MSVNEIRNDLLGQSYYKIDHESGLTVYVYPKEGYSSTYAIFGTDYGSIDADGIPNGTAHFLEHKLFESDEIDAFKRFAETGASANAYTTFDRTCYLFNCGANFYENLKILLDFVTHPYFTQETVEKEQGIIGQEIKMYQDEPMWQSLFNLLRTAYVNHPVRIDLAGTPETIAEITAETLYGCYDKFYNLGNMVLACVGDTTVDEVLKAVDEVLGKERKAAEPVTRHFDEPYEVAGDYIEQKMSVAMPQFALGFKTSPEGDSGSRPTTRERVVTSILLDCLFGQTTEFYNDLLDNGYISPNIGAEDFSGPGYRLVLVIGDSKDPKYVAEAFKKRVAEVKENGISPEDFERARKAHYGRTVMEFNDVNNIANVMVVFHFEGSTLYEELDICKELTLDEINELLDRRFDVNNVTLSVILPKE